MLTFVLTEIGFEVLNYSHTTGILKGIFSAGDNYQSRMISFMIDSRLSSIIVKHRRNDSV